MDTQSQANQNTEAQSNSNTSNTPAAEGEPSPLALTPLAAEKVREIQAAEKDIPAHFGLRLRVVGGGCSGFSYDLYFDEQQESDQIFDSQGVKLICDVMSLQYLAGTTVDYVEGLQGAGFKFTNPNVKSTCGCGSSFSA